MVYIIMKAFNSFVQLCTLNSYVRQYSTVRFCAVSEDW